VTRNLTLHYDRMMLLLDAPHHRAYGSVPGGSTRLSLVRYMKSREPERVEVVVQPSSKGSFGSFPAVPAG
jgi:hypothetical protein